MKRLIAVAVCISIALTGVLACSSAGAEQPPAAPKKKKSKKKPTPVNDPLFSLTLMRQGVVFMQQGRYDDALEKFKEADQVAPGNATNSNMIGLCYLRKQELDKAFAYFDEALRLVPSWRSSVIPPTLTPNRSTTTSA
jgi:tetratricopeptide (TPR) repeat protein